MVCVKVPTSFAKDELVFDNAVDAAAWKANEVWRNSQSSSSGSPIIHDGIVYQITDTGSVIAVKAESGEIVWESKVSNGNTHSSPLYADGRIYAPLMEGAVFVVDAKDGKELQKDRTRRQLHRRGLALQRTPLSFTPRRSCIASRSRTTELRLTQRRRQHLLQK